MISENLIIQNKSDADFIKVSRNKILLIAFLKLS